MNLVPTSTYARDQFSIEITWFALSDVLSLLTDRTDRGTVINQEEKKERIKEKNDRTTRSQRQ